MYLKFTNGGVGLHTRNVVSKVTDNLSVRAAEKESYTTIQIIIKKMCYADWENLIQDKN